MNPTELAEFTITQYAISVIDIIAKKKKIHGMTLAALVPGVVHNHPPTETLVDTCDFCNRNGNVFAHGEPKSALPGDIVQKYNDKIMVILEELRSELNDTIERKINGQDDDELDALLMAELAE